MPNRPQMITTKTLSRSYLMASAVLLPLSWEFLRTPGSPSRRRRLFHPFRSRLSLSCHKPRHAEPMIRRPSSPLPNPSHCLGHASRLRTLTWTPRFSPHCRPSTGRNAYLPSLPTVVRGSPIPSLITWTLQSHTTACPTCLGRPSPISSFSSREVHQNRPKKNFNTRSSPNRLVTRRIFPILCSSSFLTNISWCHLHKCFLTFSPTTHLIFIAFSFHILLIFCILSRHTT